MSGPRFPKRTLYCNVSRGCGFNVLADHCSFVFVCFEIIKMIHSTTNLFSAAEPSGWPEEKLRQAVFQHRGRPDQGQT